VDPQPDPPVKLDHLDDLARRML